MFMDKAVAHSKIYGLASSWLISGPKQDVFGMVAILVTVNSSSPFYKSGLRLCSISVSADHFGTGFIHLRLIIS